MISLELLVELSVIGLLLFSLILMGKTRLPSMLRHYTYASLCLAVATVALSLIRHDQHAYFAAIATVVLKAILIPWMLSRSAARANASLQLRFYLRPAATYVIALLVLLLVFFVTKKLPIEESVVFTNPQIIFTHPTLFVSLSLVVLGLVVMIIRRDLYSQIIGLLTMENGIAAFGALAVGGLPLLIEMGIIVTVMAGVLVMAILSHNVQEHYATGDTSRLTELIE